MKTVMHKQLLQLGENTISSDTYFSPLSVGEDPDGNLALWYQRTPQAATPFSVKVHVVFTGEPFESHVHDKFLGTIVKSNQLVYHVFLIS